MVKREFLGWEMPLVDAVAGWLLARRAQLPGLCAVVPTTQSGRRLRSRLAEHAGAPVSLEIITPAMILDTQGEKTALAWQETLAWCEVLESVSNWTEFESLFPQAPDITSGNAHTLAQELQKLARRLQENGHTMSSAARVLASSYDGDRWACLARLESMFRRTLANWNSASRTDVLAQRTPDCLRHREYVLAGLSDMPRLAARMFSESEKSITALVAAPEDMSGHFDDLGLPLPTWNTLPLPWPESGKGDVSLVADTRAQAREALQRVQNHGLPSDQVALGTGDPEISGELARIFTAHGWSAFDPSSFSIPTGLRRWLLAWREWLHEPGFTALHDLLSQPASDIFAPAETRLAFLKTLNERRDKDMTGSVSELMGFAASEKENLRQLAVIAQTVTERRQHFLSRPVQEATAELLEQLAPHATEEEITPIRAWLEEATPMITRVKRPPVFWLDLLLSSLSAAPPSPPDDRVIDVLGWLELPYERAPHLVVCGMNEGMVPSQIPSDPWLGESASRMLGLSTNEQRAARDAYLARYFTECRRHNGHVDWICSKTSASGDTLLPSRILLNASGEELARRVRFLFREIPPTEAGIRWQADWTWQPSQATHGERIRVTSFKDWLACPFRYYLKHVVGIQKPEPDRIEWNARDYGTIFHQIVEWWGQDEEARDFSKTEALSKWFSDRLDKLVTKRFGPSPTLAIRLQTESLRSRLHWLAHEQAVLRASGWHTIEVERTFDLAIGPWTVRGMIDRVDEHPDHGLRVIDYKTSADLGKVAAEHCSKVTAKTQLLDHWGKDSPVFFESSENGKPQTLRWTNLQLPLYVAAIRELTGTFATPCYIAVGASREKVKVDPWEDFSESELTSALACAEWIGAQIANRVFWPPAEKTPYQDDIVSALACGRPVSEMFAWHPAN